MRRYGVTTKNEAVDLALRHLAGDPMSREAALAMSGARTDAGERDLRRLLDRFALLRIDPVADFDGAVTIYRTCRRLGVTPRGLIDCVIAAVAQLADAVGLALDPASHR